MKFAFLLITLALVFSQDVNIQKIYKMQETAFGRQIYETMALQLKTEDSADDLVMTLRDQEQKLQDKQSEEDERILLEQNVCVSDLATLVDEIKFSKEKIKQIVATLKNKIPLRDSLVDEREDIQGFKALLLQKLEEMEVLKDMRVQDWEQTTEELDYAVAVFINAKSALSKSFKSSFLQKSSISQEALVQISSDLKNAKKTHFNSPHYSPLISVLATITSKQLANEGAMNKVIQLIEDIVEKIEEQRAVEKRDFDLYMFEHEKTKTGLNAKVDEAQSQIDNLTSRIDSLNKQIAQLQEQQIYHEQRVSDKQEEHDERETQCDAQAKAYSEERQARFDRMEVISDGIALLTSQIRLLKKFISDASF